MKKITNTVLISAALIILAASCRRSSSTPAVVNSVQYPLTSAINQITAAFPSSGDVYFLDVKTHGYSFTPTANGTITQLGYRFDNPLLSMADFTLSLWDAIPASAPLATTGQQTFSFNANIIYFPITPVAVLAGQTYFVSREFIPTAASSGYTSEYVGFLRRDPNNAILPLVVSLPQPGNVTINQSYFTDNADPRTAMPITNYDVNYLPYIDFEIQ